MHGCLKELEALEKAIVADALSVEGEKWILMLGDYIDRGDFSAAVIDHLLAPAPTGFRRLCIAGNHEEAFIDFINSECRKDAWLSFGGLETLASYGLYREGENRKALARKVEACIPSEHIQFIRSLPELIKTPSFCFVHAGIDPAKTLEDQSSQTLLWSRPSQFDWAASALDFTVVHGHTPVETPEMSAHRINVDIGAYATGRLAAARIARTDKIRFLFSS
ncbi:metallophosphoesterase [Rhizobium sp. L1K21]|nr:metallophosphoesterase [Rhizobium sp. L1K21]